MSLPFDPEPREMPAGARTLSPAHRRALDEVINHHAAQLRGCAHIVEGMIEHYSECDCGQDNPDHDALVLVIPEPYLSAYRKHWPAFRQLIEQEVHPVPTLTQGVPA